MVAGPTEANTIRCISKPEMEEVWDPLQAGGWLGSQIILQVS